MDKKTKMIVGVLLAAVVVLAGIVVYGFYSGWLLTQQQYAATYGYQQAMLQVIQGTRNCTTYQIPLTYNNQTTTFNLVDTECAQMQTILAIVQMSQGCKEVPLTIGNQTFTLIDVQCLQTAGNTTG